MNKQLVEKIHESVLKMMDEVVFDKEAHRYTRKSDGVWLQGVSTVSSIIPKDWLSSWGAKECSKFLGYSDYEGDTENAEIMLEKIAMLHMNNDIKGYQALLKEAKGACRRKSKDALVDGSAGHDWLELYVKAKIRGTELPKMPDGMLKRPLTQFIEWADKEVDYFILSEAMVVSPDELYAGTLDGLAMMKTGKLALIDFKFASHISEDYYLQCAGYQNCLEKYGIKVDERIIIRLPKTLTIDEWDNKTHTYSKVENKIEVKIVDTDYLLDLGTFLHCLPVKRWINIMQSRK